MPTREQFETQGAFERALRDYFAGQAVLACNRGSSSLEFARRAYSIADAMLAERAKEPKP